MSGRNFPSPNFSSGSPLKNFQQLSNRPPLYFQPNCPYLSPRGSRISSPRKSFGSPDFLPLRVSSPVERFRQSWSQRSDSNNSSYSGSGYSSPPSSNSSPNYSPYKRNNSHNNYRGRRSFSPNHSGSNSPHISLYYDKEVLRDPWAELEGKQKSFQSSNRYCKTDVDQSQSSTIPDDSANDSSSDGVDVNDEDGQS